MQSELSLIAIKLGFISKSISLKRYMKNCEYLDAVTTIVIFWSTFAQAVVESHTKTEVFHLQTKLLDSYVFMA